MKRNKGRYETADRNNPSKREITSYEEAPMPDYIDDEPEPENPTKKLFHILLVLFLSVAAVLAVYNIEYLTPDNISHWFQYDLLGKTEGQGYPVKFEGVSVETKNFGLMNGVPIYCSNTNAVVLNSNAGEYQNVRHSFANPVLSINSNYSIIYNINATGYKVLSRDKVLYEGNTSQKIFAADVSANGVYGLVTYGDDYFSTVSIYKSDNKLKFSYSFADYYVNTISINKNGTEAVVSGVSAKDGGLISVIYVLDFEQENYMQKYEFDNVYIYDVEYLNNGCLAAVGNNAAYFINPENKKPTAYSYESKTITSYSISRDYGILLSLSTNPDGRNCDFIMINSSGQKTNLINTSTKITALDYRNGSIAVLTPSLIIAYAEDGTKKGELKVSSDVRNICFFEDNKLYALGKTEVYSMEIEYKN